ncbi:hypothetical protein [Promicromonospora sukumoe]
MTVLTEQGPMRPGQTYVESQRSYDAVVLARRDVEAAIELLRRAESRLEDVDTIGCYCGGEALFALDKVWTLRDELGQHIRIAQDQGGIR